MTKISYISSLNSENGLYHLTNIGCHYAKQITCENQIRFKTQKKAEKRGLTLCSVCRQKMKQKRLPEYT